MIATMFKWILLKNMAEINAGICRMLLPNGLNYNIALTLWFFRSFGTIGTLICLNEVLLIRYVTKVVLKRIIVMNDALIGTWIQLSNIFIALVLTCVQTQSLGFKRNLQHLTSENIPEEGLPFASLTCLFILHLILAMVIVVHVCVNKFKARNTTPVIEINIPNPQAPVPPTNHQHIVINNQPYNTDLFDFSTYFLLVLFCASVFIPTSLIIFNSNVQTVIAQYYQISVKDFFSIFTHVRNFLHALVLGLLSPLILMIQSDELRPFLFRSLSCACSNNAVMIEVYN